LDKYSQPFKDGYYEHCLNTVEYFAINKFKPSIYVPGDNPRRGAIKEQRHVSRFIRSQEQGNPKKLNNKLGIGY
jgi:hypothetical protein